MFDFDPKKNYYEILGVSEDASADEIKKAFRKGAMQHHPDKKGGDQEKFKAINEAFQVLGDAGKKSQYDQVRKGGFDFSGFGGGGGGFSAEGFDIGDLLGGFGDIFGGGFGGGGSRKRNNRGDDVEVMLVVTLADLYKGLEKEISYSRKVTDPNAKPETCPECQGTGSTTQRMQTPFGVVQTQAACRRCGGTGYLGDGLKTHQEKITINVPSGMEEGQYLKYPGMGNDGRNNGPSGDLYIQVRVKDRQGFSRKGDDLYYTTKVTLFDLVLGGEITIAHPSGDLKVKIPKGTQPTDLIRVSGKGFGRGGLRNKAGDLLIKTALQIPKKLSKDEEKHRKELQKLAG